jgi:hypothetical protein
VLDAGRADPLKITNSDGRRTVLPASDLTKRVRVTTLTNFTGGVTATAGHINPDRFVGFGLVTRFGL